MRSLIAEARALNEGEAYSRGLLTKWLLKNIKKPKSPGQVVGEVVQQIVKGVLKGSLDAWISSETWRAERDGVSKKAAIQAGLTQFEVYIVEPCLAAWVKAHGLHDNDWHNMAREVMTRVAHKLGVKRITKVTKVKRPPVKLRLVASRSCLLHIPNHLVERCDCDNCPVADKCPRYKKGGHDCDDD
jgi:hypothetical protein